MRVAIGLLRDAAGRVLISRRRGRVHLSGLWEFPGGKCAPGEDARGALERELHEELGIEVVEASRILTVPHDYPERRVELAVFRVDAWRGEPQPREAQPLYWAQPAELAGLRFPEASRAIVNAARLPAFYLISPDPDSPAAVESEARRVARRLARGGIRLLQIRAPGLGQAAFLDYAHRLMAAAAGHGVEVLVNAPETWREALPPAGCHLSERCLRALGARPDCDGWIAASVHDLDGLERAMALPVDFVVAGPVERTRTHPDAQPIGVSGLAALCGRTSCPVFALGGLQPGDLGRLRAVGAQGIAGIRGLLD
ncbi:Nudix family hydrolase [Thioalkalivibrio sp.]|uniref:Nudix family hydrolase n=1 Tax=Thioalkalivibrio sp. TaxID=2093813 RepID=UPI003566ACC1